MITSGAQMVKSLGITSGAQGSNPTYIDVCVALARKKYSYIMLNLQEMRKFQFCMHLILVVTLI